MIDMDVSQAALQPVEYRLNDPILRYKLDPGEPGLLRSARASESMAAVSAQERGNLNQFKREAFIAGRVIISESITFTRGIDGLFSTIRAGLTEVVSIPAPSSGSTQKPVEAENTPAPGIENSVPQIPRDESGSGVNQKEIKIFSKLSALKSTIQEVKALAEKIKNEIPPGNGESNISINNDDAEKIELPEIEIIPEKAEVTDDGEVIPQVGLALEGNDEPEVDLKIPEYNSIQDEPEFDVLKQDDVLRHEMELRELRDKLKDLQMMRVRAGIEQMSEVMIDAIEENISMLSKLVSVSYHVGPDSHFNDLSSEVPALGMVLDYSV